MTTLKLTTAALGVGLALTIFVLVRRGHMQLGRGGFWLTVAALAFVLGVSPGLVDRVAAAVGIAYPPSFLLLLAVIVLFIKALLADIASTRLERQIRRLNQRMAIYEAEHDARQSRPQPMDTTD